MTNIILASGSPRRKELLSTLGLPFSVKLPNVDESLLPNEKPQDLVSRLSLLKSEYIANLNKDSIVIAADTVVALDDEILGKPKDRNDAFLMLKKLSNKTHCVYTGTCIRYKDKIINFVVGTKVIFDNLSDDLIKTYVESGECDDKAGSYAIQGIGSMLISKIEGSVSCVIGLPICEVRQALKEFNITPKVVTINE